MFTRVLRLLIALCALAAVACSRCEDTWDGYAQAFLITKCERCHGAMGNGARVAKDREKIMGMLASGKMPPQHGVQIGARPSEAVSPEERDRILRYLQCGAKGAR